MTSLLRVGVLLSGTGRTLENLLRKIDAGEIPARVVAVASNKEGVRGLEIARDAGIACATFPRSEYATRKARDAAMLVWIRGHRPDVVTLAGYLALLDLDQAAGIPILNIHPALLPRFGGRGYYGDRVHAAVLAAGEKETGATVHLVDPEYDRGPILEQIRVPVEPEDDVRALADRVFTAECELYPRVLRRIAAREIVIDHGRVRWEHGEEGQDDPTSRRVEP